MKSFKDDPLAMDGLLPIAIPFVIIAQNESSIIADAIRSCDGLGEVFVVDGGSTDDTVEVASGLGARVARRAFTYHADQYNWALRQVETPWAFVLDADERLSQALQDELRSLRPDAHVLAFEVSRLNHFCGEPIRHSDWYPDRNVRLFKPAIIKYEDRAVHARINVPEGRTGRLTEDLLHLSYRSVSHYVAKMNFYTDLEVAARTQNDRPVDIRSRYRSLYLRLPARPLVRFLYMFVFRRGFLDGRAGYTVARLSAIYEYVASEKVRRRDRHADATSGDLRDQ